jgi:hypothetical protein
VNLFQMIGQLMGSGSGLGLGPTGKRRIPGRGGRRRRPLVGKVVKGIPCTQLVTRAGQGRNRRGFTSQWSHTRKCGSTLYLEQKVAASSRAQALREALTGIRPRVEYRCVGCMKVAGTIKE